MVKCKAFKCIESAYKSSVFNSDYCKIHLELDKSIGQLKPTDYDELTTDLGVTNLGVFDVSITCDKIYSLEDSVFKLQCWKRKNHKGKHFSFGREWK